MSEPGAEPGDMAATARHAEDLGSNPRGSSTSCRRDRCAPSSTAARAGSRGVAPRPASASPTASIILPLRPVAGSPSRWPPCSTSRATGSPRRRRRGRPPRPLSWSAAGVPRPRAGSSHGRRPRLLPDLISGKPTDSTSARQPAVQLAPAAAVPPILVGGMSDAAMARAVTRADGWFLLPLAPAEVTPPGSVWRARRR